MKKLELDNFFKVSLYASGMHLSKLHGWTIDEVTKNHKNIFFDETVASDSPDSISKSTSLTIMSFSSYIKEMTLICLLCWETGMKHLQHV